MKKLLGLFLFLSAQLFSQIPTAGLIGGWPFTGNAQDMSGSGNHGTPFGATLTADRFGAPNCAYNFNGTSNYIDMITAGPTGSVSRSVSFWERTTYTSNISVGFTYGQPGSGGSFQVNFNYSCPAVGFDNSSSAVMRGTSIINNGSWHHIVVVLNSTIGIATGNVLIYVDGVQQTALSCAVSGTNSIINTNSIMPIRIGRDGGVRYFKGDLDDFYMYNRAITPTEVLQLFNDAPCTASPTDPGTINGNATLCSGSTSIYSITPVPGATSYTWALPGGWTGTSSTNTIAVTAALNSGLVTVVAGNACGNSQPSTTNINVNPTPSVSISASQATICNGNSTTLIGNGASTYTWNSSINSPSITVSPSVTTTYTLVGENSFGCAGTLVTTINVTNNPLPTIATSGPTLICSGQTANIASNGASTYTWQPGNLNGFLIGVSPTVTTIYTVTGTDGNGCYNSTTYVQNVSACTAINEQSLIDGFVMYPNPFNNILIVNSISDNSKIEIYDALGNLVYFKELDEGESEINLSEKESGIYFVRVIRESATLTKKIIKQ